MVIFQGKEEQCWIARNSRYNTKHEQACVRGKAIKVDDDHDTFVERFQEDVINQRRHQVKRMMKRKVIGTMGTTQLEIKLVVQGKMI